MNSGTCSSGKRSGGFALAFLLAALSLQCAGPDRDGALRIAMIPKLVGIGYFEATERGAREAARELNLSSSSMTVPPTPVPRTRSR